MITKKKQIVKFDNRFNSISVRNIGFKETEYRLLWFMCYKAVDQGSENIRITFDELRESGVIRKNCSKKEVKEILNEFYTKLKNFEYISEDYDVHKNVKRWLVFYGYETHFENDEMDFRVTPEAVFFFNELSKGFTVFEYKEMLLLKSNDGMNLFRQLKQWRTIGRVTYTLEHVKNFMDIPEDTPTKKVTSLVKKAINDLKKNLPLTYANLTVEAVKNKRSIVGYVFKFDPESPTELQGKNIISLENENPSIFESKSLNIRKEIIATYDWKMPNLIKFNKPTNEYIAKFKDNNFMTPEAIVDSWNNQVKEEYFENIEVVTPKFNEAVFDEKIKNYVNDLELIEGNENINKFLNLLKKAITNITDSQKIYSLNNCKYRQAHSFVQKSMFITEDETINNKIGYLKKVIENEL